MSRETYIKELLIHLVDGLFPDDEVGNPLVRKTGDGRKHKIRLAQLLEDVILNDKYKHKLSGDAPFIYSFSKKDKIRSIFRDRTKDPEIDLNDPQGRTYKETDPYNEEGIKRLFKIDKSLIRNNQPNKSDNSTQGYILKEDFHPYAVLTKLNSITYARGNGEDNPPPKNALPKTVIEYTGADITTKVEINREAISIAIRQIEFARTISKDLLDIKDYKINNELEKFIRNDLKDGSKIYTYKDIDNRLYKLWRSLYVLDLYASTNSLNTPYIYQEYREETNKNSGNGRLWGKIENNILNIQELYKPIRNIALTDMSYIDYDINNCHIAILNQFYEMATGKKDNELNEYCKNYDQNRHNISKESDVDYGLVKEFILSITYGGTYLTFNQINTLNFNTLQERFDIVNTFYSYYPREKMVREKLNAITNSPTMINFYATIKRVNEEIDNISKKKNVYGKYGAQYINPCLKELPIENKQNKKLAHILQGIEAITLRSIIKDDPSSILSLHHDGWIGKEKELRTTNKQIDGYKSHLTEVIYEETKKKMIEWNKKIGTPLPNPGGFVFNISHSKIVGFDNIKCSINPNYSNSLKGSLNAEK